jgi:hypothetical protein
VVVATVVIEKDKRKTNIQNLWSATKHSSKQNSSERKRLSLLWNKLKKKSTQKAESRPTVQNEN